MTRPYRMIVACAMLAACSPTTTTAAAPPLAGAAVGGPFSLLDQNGRQVTDKDFAGKYRIMYFGYTFCPDVCPIDMQKIGAALRQFESRDVVRAGRVVPIFVTVDPERDKPASLKQFVSAFHPRAVGLTGTVEEIARVAKEFAIYYKHQAKQPDGSYLVDHSTQAYLIGPKGEPIALFTHDQTADQIATELDRWVK